MTNDALTVARWKCAFLAKRIVALREQVAQSSVLDEIKLHQNELDVLIATIARDCGEDAAAGDPQADSCEDVSAVTAPAAAPGPRLVG